MRTDPVFFRPADLLALALVLALGLKTLPWLWTGTGGTATVSVDGKKVMRLQLQGPERRAQVTGALGPMEVEWGGRGARIRQAPCPRRLCVQTGFVRRLGHRVVCVPSHVEIAVMGGPKAGPRLDGVTF